MISKSQSNTSFLGFQAEVWASRYLEKKGYKILGHNYRKPWGELDLIASKEGLIIFVEVKANRIEHQAFEPEIRADWKKMSKVVRTARTYLASHDFPPEQEWQIDVISVTFVKKRGVAKIRHYKNIEI